MVPEAAHGRQADRGADDRRRPPKPAAAAGTLADIMPVRAETGNRGIGARGGKRGAARAGARADRPVRVFANGIEPGVRATLPAGAVVIVRAARKRLIDASGRRGLSRRPNPSRR
ncbi:hypothetical protein [Burkholderia sp. RF2-non_BP3]|uniref:hypothetical protein n=1 Tax=Burkholderia sp. RF2-non_BP3 TaxID=1637844 RepID=UPI000A5E79AA|nr:hypothetical protein [Burkholderia sp. RF2-non_BP3]